MRHNTTIEPDIALVIQKNRVKYPILATKGPRMACAESFFITL